MPSAPSHSVPLQAILEHNYIPISLLTTLVGYKKAKALEDYSIRTPQAELLTIPQIKYTLFEHMYKQCPQELCSLIVSKMSFQNIPHLQTYYASFFKKEIPFTTMSEVCLPHLYMVKQDTLAISTDSQPVQIWSLADKKLQFKSARISGRCMCAIASTLIVSESSTIQRLNILELHNSENNSCETLLHNLHDKDYKTILLTTNQRIALLFPYNNHAIIGTQTGCLEGYDFEGQSNSLNVFNAHAEPITAGLQVDAYSFVTASADNTVCGWDMRNQKKMFTTELPHWCRPYTIRRFNEYTVLIGCNTNPSLNGIDIRKTADWYSTECPIKPVHDFEVLRDKTIVLCTKNIEFGRIEGNIFKKIRTIEEDLSSLELAVSPDDVLAIADIKSRIFLLQPLQPPLCLWERVELDSLCTAVALESDTTQ